MDKTTEKHTHTKEERKKERKKEKKNRTHVFKILNTICGENCESLWVQVSL
jgi:hypothetical protein